MKIIGFITITFIIAIFGFSKQTFEYRISNNYSGPCIVFIDSTIGKKKQQNFVVIKNGLGRISKDLMSRSFEFVTLETNSKMEIIEAGLESKVDTNSRFIFQLGNGVVTLPTCKGDIKNVSFFVGKKKEFMDWSLKFTSEFEYFDSIGVDWCKYYYHDDK